MTGIGAQIALSVYLATILACIFYTTPIFRPLTFYGGVLLLALCGFLNGFMTSRMFKFFNLQWGWRTSALLTSLIFPCYVLLCCASGDIIESYMGSSAAVPFSEGLLHYLIWWAIDAPLAAYGAYRGNQAELSVEPEVGQIRKKIPAMPWYLTRPAIVLIYGPIIFATVFFEFEYIMDSIWRSYMIYGMFLVLLGSLVMMGVTIAALSICITYKLLCHGNYDWWWHSFCLGVSGGLYMLAYSMYYMFFREEYKVLSEDILYYLIMTLICSCYGFMCGAISILASYLFVERIYNVSSKGQFTKF